MRPPRHTPQGARRALLTSVPLQMLRGIEDEYVDIPVLMERREDWHAKGRRRDG